jgi:hypothetical protein
VNLNLDGTNEPIVDENLSETPEVNEELSEEVVAEEVVAEEVVAEEVVAEEVVAEEVVAEEAPVAKSPVDKGHFKEELGQYIENFGKDLGVEYFMGEMDFASAQSEYIKSQANKIEELNAQIELAEQTENVALSGNNGENIDVKNQGFKVKFSN